MKKKPLHCSIMAIAAFLLVACGDEVTQINQTGLDVVTSVGDLPKCTKENEGEQALVKGEPTVRVCIDGEWFATKSGDDSGFSCKTEELKDKSGLKIVCNGDSIGVVLNGNDGHDGKAGKDGENGKDGSDGEDGKAGSGCTISGKTDSTVTVKCGDSTMVLEIGGETGIGVLEPDSERIAVSLDSLAGFTQKGPFLKGSTVYLYELSDGRTLKQTNGNFTSMITRDDGRYKFTARDLASQYAMIVVEGNYRNEVTGKTSNATIRLRAITDMRKHSDANINLLTHLEFDRVYYLVTREKMTVKKAKKQAQKEIFAQFNIAADDFEDSENLDVFGTSEADAALLAISILLQGDRSETELLTLLTAIGNDMETDGKWNEPGADSIKVALALWAMNNHGNLEIFRKNVEGWNLGPVPPFEKYIEAFFPKALGLNDCEASNEGTSLTIDNKYSPFHGQTFVCKDGNYVAIRTEKTQFNPDIHYGEMIDMRDHKVYKTVNIGTQTWMAENLDFADTLAYPALKTGMKCYENDPANCDKNGRLYARGIAFDTLRIYSNGVKECFATINGYTYKGGGECNYSYPVRGICPEGWHIPSGNDWRILFLNYTSAEQMIAKDSGGTDIHGLSVLPVGYWGENFYYSKAYNAVFFWHVQSSKAGTAGNAVRFGFQDAIAMKSGVGNMSYTYDNAYLPLRCLKNKEIEYGQLVDERDGHKYKTVEIAGKVWMAENLNFRTEPVEGDSSSFCHTNRADNCEKYGRYYTWESAQTACPQGWHLPDSTEWADVYMAHGLSSNAMLAMGFDREPFAENSLGLGLIPRMERYDRFREDFSTNYEFVWSSYSRDGKPYAWMNVTTDDYNIGRGYLYQGNYEDAFSIRCVQDD